MVCRDVVHKMRTVPYHSCIYEYTTIPFVVIKYQTVIWIIDFHITDISHIRSNERLILYGRCVFRFILFDQFDACRRRPSIRRGSRNYIRGEYERRRSRKLVDASAIGPIKFSIEFCRHTHTHTHIGTEKRLIGPP